MRRLLLFGTIRIVAATGGSEMDQDEAAGRREKLDMSGLGISVAVDRPAYALGDAISVTLGISNRTGEEVTSRFISAQRYDFFIEDEERNDIWRWSDRMTFAQVLNEEKLVTGGEEMAYTVRYEGSLDPGTYTITGTVTSRNRPMSASVSVAVK